MQRIHQLSGGCPRVICAIADLSLVVGRSAGVRMVDLPQVAQAHADMEKNSSDSFHYYHFLHSAKNARRKAKASETEMPEAPGLPVIVESSPESTPLRTKLRRRWRDWRARAART